MITRDDYLYILILGSLVLVAEALVRFRNVSL